MKLSQYPRSADGTPLDMVQGVLTDASGNGGARATERLFSPDGSPVEQVGVVLTDKTGAPLGGMNDLFAPRFIDPRSFGMVANDISARAQNTAAMLTMLAYLESTADASAGWIDKGGQRVLWPYGTFYFDSPASGYFSLKSAVHFEGQTSPRTMAPGTRLVFSKGGFIVERFNTLAGGADPDSDMTDGGGGSIFRYLYLESEQARPSPANYAAQATSGIIAYDRVTVENCFITGFTLDGITILGGAYSGVSNTNANNVIINYNEIEHSGRHGIFLDGGDSNAGSLIGNSLNFNNEWGIKDSSFLGNYHWGHHASSNGVSGIGGKSDGKTSVVTYPGTPGAGTTYYANPSASLAALSTTQPGTNNAVWVRQAGNAGLSSPSVDAPLWVSGTTYKIGGSYFYDGITGVAWTNTYSEGNQGQPWMGTHGMLIGGSWEWNPNTPGGQAIDCGGGVYTMHKPIYAVGGINLQDGAFTRGNTDPAVVANQFDYRDNTAFVHQTIYRYWAAGVPTTIGSTRMQRGFGFYLDSQWGVILQHNGVDVLYADSTGVNLQGAGLVYKVNGTKVVGARQTGTPSNATDLATALTLVNDLKAKLIAHGLIS